MSNVGERKPAIDWGRIETDDQYLGRVFFAAWYTREEEPIEFALLCGLVAGRLCRAKVPQ